jgi:hypothetical protein
MALSGRVALTSELLLDADGRIGFLAIDQERICLHILAAVKGQRIRR